MRARGLAALAALGLLLPAGEAPEAALDAVREQAVGAVAPLLRWDNVEGAPLWAGGVAPRRERHLHVLTLTPGEATRLWLPAGTLLRLHAPTGRLAPEDLAIAVSQGSGLAVEAVPTPSADGRDLLLRIPSAWPAVVTLSRPPGASGALSVGAFVARLTAPPDPIAYRDRVDLPGPDACLWFPRRWNREAYDVLAPAAPQEVTVTGPARLMLETRLPYDEGPPAWVRSYRIRAALDGRPVQVMEFSTSPEGAEPVRTPCMGLAVGAAQRGYLDVPAGTHRLSLEADARLLLRVLQHDRSDWLLRGLNAPPGTSLDQVVTGEGWDGGAGVWAVEEEDLRRALGPVPPGATQAERLARRLARDTEWSAGLAGAALLDRAARRAPGLPEAEAAAERIRGAGTFWRDLVPAQSASRQEAGWVALPVLNDPLALVPRQVPPDLPRDVLLSRLVRAVFVAPPGGDGPPLLYPLPEREAPSALRMLVDRSRLTAPAGLMVQVGQAPPRRIVVRPAPELPPEAYAESPAAAGLLRLPPGDGTRSGVFAASREAGRQVEAGAVEIALPQSAATVRVWAESAGAAPPVALQYRASRHDALEDEAYPAAIAALGRERALRLFARVLSDAVRCEAWLLAPLSCPGGVAVGAAGPAARSPLNEWIPLLRLLRARYRSEFATVAADAALAPPRAAGSPATAEARAAERRGDWLGALEAWTRVADSAGGEAWWQAQLGRAGALRRLGEAYLAERLLKALHRAPAAPAGIRRQAFEALRELALATGDPEALLGPLAAELAAGRGADPALLAELVAALAAGARDQMAAVLGLLLPPGARPPALPVAALRAGWEDVFAALVAEEPDAARRAVLEGVRAARRGEEDAALATFRDAGPEGAPWAAALERGQAIRTRLSPDGTATPEVARDWAAWWAAHPGPRIWEDAEGLVAAHAGGAVLEATARDLPLRAWRAAPGQPVRLDVAGPALLRIEARPLHPGRSGPPLEGSVVIAAAGQPPVTIPVSRNQVAPGLSLVGGGGAPGTAVTEVLAIPAGRHGVTVTPRGFGALVRASIGRPALPLAVLPPPQPALVPPGGALPGAPGALATDPGAAQRHRLGELIRRFEARPEGDAAALAEAARLAQQYPETPGLSSLWARLAQQSRWERVTALDSSAGYRAVPAPGWQPEAPALRARTALLPRLTAEEELLGSGSEFAVSFVNTTPTVVEARLALADLPGTAARPLTVRYRLDEGAPRSVRLTPGQPATTLRIPVPEGEHGLRFSIADPQSNRFVRLRLSEGEGARPAPRDPERSYDVATAAEPVVLTLEGPAWLRIDELGPEGAVAARYRHVGPGWQTLQLRPPPGRDELPLRIFRLVPDRGAPLPAPPPLAAPETAPRAPIVVPDQPAADPIILTDRLPLGGQEDGTWSLSASIERILPPDEDPGLSRSALYGQMLAGWRYLDAHGTRWRGEVLGRRDLEGGAGPTLGLRGRVEHPLAEAPLTLFAGASGYAQLLEGHGTAWAGTLSGGVRWENEISETTRQYATVAGFVRGLGGLSAAEARRLDPDPDVFTRYKDEHRHGLVLSYTLSHRPWLDTIWTLGASMTTNEDLNPFGPDRASVSAGWQQLLGPVVLDAGITQTRYFDDGDRAAARNDTLLRLGLLWEGWRPSGDRWEVGATVGYRTLADEWIGLVSLTWHFGSGRGLMDFTPAEAPFARLRERPLFGLARNGIGYVPGY